MERRTIQVEEKVPAKLLIPLSIQHMFAMFGASVLVPFLFHINPAIVLLMNGVGTLLFILITKGKAPAYLGSDVYKRQTVTRGTKARRIAETANPIETGLFLREL